MRRLEAAVGWTGVFPARRDEVKDALGDELLTMSGAAAHVGVPWRCMKGLREVGLVTPVWSVGPDDHHFYYKAELDTFVKSLLIRAPAFEELPRTLVTLKRLSKSKALYWWRLLEEVTAGRLAVAGVLRGAPGVQALLFEPDAIASHFRKRPPDTLTKSAIKGLLDLDEAAWSAIDGTLLSSTSTSVMT